MEPWRRELYATELYHYGIKGMRWGVRRFQDRGGSLTALGKKHLQSMRDKETAYRNKLTAITKNNSANPADVKRFKYRNRSLVRRFGANVASAAVGTLIGDIMTGQYKNYASMSKRDIATKLLKIGKSAALNTAISDAMAKSASKRYTDSGKKVRGVKDHFIPKETWIEMGIDYAKDVATLAPFFGILLHAKAARIRKENAHYEEVFRKWGANILTEKVSDIVFVTD